MLSRRRILTFGALGVLLLVAALPQTARAGEVLKIGTLAPKSSPWGMVFSTWAKAVSEKSGGRLELQIFYNGAQGDDDTMIAKIKSGQLNGAAVTGLGLGKVYKPILALQMPGLFTSWAKLDKARDALKGEFEKGALDAGFRIAGWGDVGLVRTFSKGFPLLLPTDLQGKKAMAVRADPLTQALFKAIGGVSAVPLNVPEVLPNLNTGAINALLAPCLAVEQLQWSSKLDHINDHIAGVAIGAVVFSQKVLDALPADLRTIVLDTAKVAATALTKRIRSEDDAAFARLKGKVTVTTPSADQRAAWDAAYRQARQGLTPGTFSSDLVTRLEGYAR